MVRSLAVRAVFSASGLAFSMGLKKFTLTTEAPSSCTAKFTPSS